MAVDTKTKQLAVMTAVYNVALLTLPEGDGPIDEFDRAHILGLYIDETALPTALLGHLEGTLEVGPRLEGLLTASPRLVGVFAVTPRLTGKMEVNDMENVLHPNEDNKIKMVGLLDPEQAAPQFVNDASGSFSVLTAAGVAIATMTDIPLTYIASSNGDYLGFIDKAEAATLTDGTDYIIEATLASSGRDSFRRFKLPARYHGSDVPAA